MQDGFFTNVESEYPDYLRDESRRTGQAGSISFPRSEEELCEHLRRAARDGVSVTVQGARTGITGGAVPAGGHVINLSRMTRVTGLRRDAESGDFLLTVEPGALLSELREAIDQKSFDIEAWSPALIETLEAFLGAGAYFFSPDPTETSAAIGGMAATNASGARSFLYGPTRRHIEALRVALVDGAVLELRRGRERARGRHFTLTDDAGRTLDGDLPSYRMPDVKNAAGYFAEDDMDMIDLFIGSEGTLGVLSAIELRLVPLPPVEWGVTAFLPDEESGVRFVESVRALPGAPSAIEFFDSRALDLLRRQKESNPAFGELPVLEPGWHTAVYVEYHGTVEDAVEDAVVEMSEALVECGGSEEATWIASDERDMSKLKDFRHAVPEAVNLLIDERRKREPALTKLGTDLAVPDGALRDVLSMYHAGLDAAGLEYVMFGHIGSNHVHVNIIPRDMADYERGKALYIEWGKAVVALGGSVSAEHGIGKLKTALLGEMYGEQGIREMRAVKRVFDPAGRLNPGNLFDAES